MHWRRKWQPTPVAPWVQSMRFSASFEFLKSEERENEVARSKFSSVAQLCLTLRDCMDWSPPGSSVHGIFQAGVLEWGAIAFSTWYSRCFHQAEHRGHALVSLDATRRDKEVSAGVWGRGCSAGDQRSIPGLGRSPEGGCGNPLQYSCLENPHGQRSLWATVHGVAKSRARLSTPPGKPA